MSASMRMFTAPSARLVHNQLAAPATPRTTNRQSAVARTQPSLIPWPACDVHPFHPMPQPDSPSVAPAAPMTPQYQGWLRRGRTTTVGILTHSMDPPTTPTSCTHHQLLQPDQRSHIVEVGLIRHLNASSSCSAVQASSDKSSIPRQQAQVGVRHAGCHKCQHSDADDCKPRHVPWVAQEANQ